MSDILTNWRQGRGLPGVLAIDGHIHIGEWPHAATFPDAQTAAEESVACLDANGIELACAQSGGYMFGGADYRLGNDFLLDVCGRIPERMVGFAHINPNDTRDGVLTELDRMHEAGVRCLKLLNAYQNYPGDGPNLMEVYEYADQRGMLILNHRWEPDVLRGISQEFTRVDFIFGHYQSSQDSLLRERPNVYANTWSMFAMGTLDRALREVGAGKLLMGSDGFLNPLSVGVGPVVFAPVSDEEKRKVLGLTMARLLDERGVLPDSIRSRWGEQFARV
jgi:predicted TIM-barrel fold metal-dependent hydrolase